LTKVTEEAQEFFTCDLLQMSFTEILEDSSDTSDILGFGLAVKRPEFAIDDPTMLQIHVVSSTIVVQSAMQVSEN
jgi:hypothetical protein